MNDTNQNLSPIQVELCLEGGSANAPEHIPEVQELVPEESKIDLVYPRTYRPYLLHALQRRTDAAVERLPEDYPHTVIRNLFELSGTSVRRRCRVGSAKAGAHVQNSVSMFYRKWGVGGVRDCLSGKAVLPTPPPLVLAAPPGVC